METLYKTYVTSTFVFVANKVFEYILLNTTSVIEVLEFYPLNKRKIKSIFGKFYPKIYPKPTTVYSRAKLLTKYHNI